jgi:LacI family transcriptional regulator
VLTVTLADIARATGLSKNAVSLALRGDDQIPETTRARVRQTATNLGYKPNAIVSHLMAQLGTGRNRRFRAKLALVNANRDRDAFRRHPTIPTYVAGCEARAAKLGYGFDRFWLHDPTLNAERFSRILRARGIQGLVLVGLMDTNRLPEAMRPVWERWPTVVTGVRTRDPALSFASVDHHDLVLTAAERVRALGYRRPALVLDDVIDELVERRFSAGFHTAQREWRAADRVPIFGRVPRDDVPPAEFQGWLDRHKPDVVFTLYNNVLAWLSALEWRVPEEVGVVQLEWRSARPDIAGMNQHNHVAGEAAVDMVVSQIHHRETGVQEFPRATLIGATWMPGASVRKSSSPAAGVRRPDIY